MNERHGPELDVEAGDGIRKRENATGDEAKDRATLAKHGSSRRAAAPAPLVVLLVEEEWSRFYCEYFLG